MHDCARTLHILKEDNNSRKRKHDNAQGIVCVAWLIVFGVDCLNLLTILFFVILYDIEKNFNNRSIIVHTRKQYHVYMIKFP